MNTKSKMKNNPPDIQQPHSFTTGINNHQVVSKSETQSESWKKSRRGASSGRGYHFQDLVGSWLASRIASGDLGSARLVPESIDDLVLESETNVLIQAKSRQIRLGHFPIHTFVKHVTDVWISQSDSLAEGCRFIIVLEHGVKDLNIDSTHPLEEIPIQHLFSQIDGLEDRLKEKISAIDPSYTSIDLLVSATSLIFCTWDDLTQAAKRQINKIVELPPTALTRIAIELRSMVADAVDKNAEVCFSERVVLDRTELVAAIHDAAEQIDLDALEHALSAGICTFIDKRPIEAGDAYYEGISTQPGHVYAGLVIHRPDLLGLVTKGFDLNQPVLLTGPSGVGKSAVLWTVPIEFPEVLWFKVHRVSPSEIPHIVRLFRAFGASPRTPVGLLLDISDHFVLENWSKLNTAIAEIPGGLLIGAVRNEDLLLLGDLADTQIIHVSLDVQSAATIHEGLVRRGSTTTPHWREAFEQSNGLTLEFTHLLSSGIRLQQVLTDQIKDRIRENRTLELEILTVVTTADRWSASIHSQKLEAYLQTSTWTLRSALERLVKEHLLSEQDGRLFGTHPIRSRGIVKSIHSDPPPQLSSSVGTVIGLLELEQLSQFIYKTLAEVPSIENEVLEVLSVSSKTDPAFLIAALHGLKLLDFHKQVTNWLEALTLREFPTAFRLWVILYAIGELEIPNDFPVELRLIAQDIVSRPSPLTTQRALIELVGTSILAEFLGSENPEVILNLLKAMRHSTVDWKWLKDTLEANCNLLTHLQECPLDQLGHFILATRDVSVELAAALSELIGGNDMILDRIHASDPWIQELKVVSCDNETIAVARYLFVSEAVQGDASERSVKLGKQILRILPEIDRVDIRAQPPGGGTLEINGYEYGMSGLLRKYFYDDEAVLWNQNRFQLARSLIGSTETERLQEARQLLPEVAQFIRDVAKAFVLDQTGTGKHWRGLDDRRAALSSRARWLQPKRVTFPPSDHDDEPLRDSFSGLVGDICDNIVFRLLNPAQYHALSAYIIQTVLGKHVPDVRNQPWYLIGNDHPPSALDEIVAVLVDIHVILVELTEEPQASNTLVNLAQRIGPSRALVQVAKLAKQRTIQRVQAHRKKVESALKSTPYEVKVYWVDGDRFKGEMSNFAVSVSVDRLTDWCDSIVLLLPIIQSVKDVLETPLLVPVLHGYTVPLCAQQVTEQGLSAADLGHFASMLPTPVVGKMTVEVGSALSALQVISGLSVLDDDDPDPRIHDVLRGALRDLNDAVERVVGLGQDDVVLAVADYLFELSKDVEGEWTGNSDTAAFARENFNKLKLPYNSESVIDQRDFLFMLSIHWDVNSESAISFFNSLSE